MTWKSEAEMLGSYMQAARAAGFRTVPEACGHDLILVAGPLCRGGDIVPGDIIAVEGKLRGNLEVLSQARPRSTISEEPTHSADFYVVVVATASPAFRAVADAMRVVVSHWLPDAWTRYDALTFRAPYRQIGCGRMEVPDLDVVMEAGMPSPRLLSPWKIGAVTLCRIGAARELLSRDFRAHGQRPSMWLDRRWARCVGREGTQHVYRLLDAADRPDRLYPEIAAALASRAGSAVESATDATQTRPGPLFGGAP